MKVETLLPLGKVDPGLRKPRKPYDLRSIFQNAQLVESLGYDGLMFEETKQDPFIACAIAAEATHSVKIGTAVAMAFPRSPAITALTAWNIQHLSSGRFVLGLGTQVKGHIERRYGLKWRKPGPWIREYVLALREIWASWQEGRQPNVSGDVYKISMTIPLFDPGPIDHPKIPIHLAAVNPYMARLAGEVAEGVRPHPVCTPTFIREVMWPEIRKGLARSGRDEKRFSIAIKPLIATASTPERLDRVIEDVRARIAFYGATWSYRKTFEFNGLEETAENLRFLSKSGRWEEMPAYINDEILHEYACVGLHKDIASVVKSKYEDIVTDVEFSIPVDADDYCEKLREMIIDLR
ncbi:MAG: TIGR03617 family F420-dependent LLM class oxidoreductase [Pseudomonadota bacterium]|nr:TIGR03617 family F420-dependent LLM class oxidoreductase [Pseudomonadota bacterium]